MEEQLRIQLAGCAVAAMGGIKGEQLARPGDYGWSPAYQDVVDLRRRYEELLAQLSERDSEPAPLRIVQDDWGDDHNPR